MGSEMCIRDSTKTVNASVRRVEKNTYQTNGLTLQRFELILAFDDSNVTTIEGPGAGATMTASVASGSLTGIAVDTKGSGYNTAPPIQIFPAVGDTITTQATAHALVADGKITSVVIDNAGAGYTSAPTVVVTNTGTSGTGFAATATVSGGAVTGITVTNPGTGYTSAPTLVLSGGGFTTQSTITIQLKKGLIENYNSLDRQLTVNRQGDLAPFLVGDVIGNVDGYATIGSFTNKVINEVALNGSSIIPSATTALLAKVAINETSSATAVGADGVTETYTDIDFNLSLIHI